MHVYSRIEVEEGTRGSRGVSSSRFSTISDNLKGVTIGLLLGS